MEEENSMNAAPQEPKPRPAKRKTAHKKTAVRSLEEMEAMMASVYDIEAEGGMTDGLGSAIARAEDVGTVYLYMDGRFVGVLSSPQGFADLTKGR